MHACIPRSSLTCQTPTQTIKREKESGESCTMQLNCMAVLDVQVLNFDQLSRFCGPQFIPNHTTHITWIHMYLLQSCAVCGLVVWVYSANTVLDGEYSSSTTG